MAIRSQAAASSDSQWASVLSGLPQGSALEPTLFAVYINDLAVEMTNTDRLYADDSKIMCAIYKEDDSHLSLQADIDKLVDWTKTWEMFTILKNLRFKFHDF